MAINDITGDNLISRKLSKEGEENFDRIFGKKKTNGGWIPPINLENDNISIPDDMYELEQRLNRIAEGEDTI